MRAFTDSLGRVVPVLALAALTSVGCANAPGGDDLGENGGRPDARPRADAGGGGGFGPDADPFVFPADAAAGTPTPDAAAAACTTGTWTSIGANGGFDADPIVWSQYSKSGNGVIVNAGGPITPPSAPRYAWLGGNLDDRAQVYQTVTVPARVAGFRVRGKVCVASEEVNPDAFDLMGITLHDGTSKAQLEPAIKTWSNLDKLTPCGFKDFTAPAANSYGGQDVTVVFTSTTDFSKNTNFFLDSVVIEASVCP